MFIYLVQVMLRKAFEHTRMGQHRAGYKHKFSGSMYIVQYVSYVYEVFYERNNEIVISCTKVEVSKK